ncbi:MAG: glycosyltransferase family 2 protein [Actinobacteria bacterium]|nr:MAG: glycosyltransferase family 2 protein [Actinomycetota bacterium]
MGEYDYAVLMPVYNEAATVGAVLDAVRVHYHGEVLVVDDGSTDGTQSVLAERDDILPLWHPENLGYGRSLIDGLAYARFIGLEYLVTMDCDGQHEPAHIPQFFAELMAGGDIISGSRYLPDSGSAGEAPEERRRINEQVTAEVNRVTGWGLTDAFCGFKAYHLPALDALALSEQGYAFPMQLWAQAWKAGLSVREVAVERIYVTGDRSFGEDLDDPGKRLEYYLRVWRDSVGSDE